MIPVLFDLTDKAALVVGFGAVGQHKAAILAREGAVVTVVSDLLPTIDQSAYPHHHFINKAYEESDLNSMDIVVAATDDKVLNTAIAAAAKAQHILCSMPDDGANGDFTFMSQINRGDLTIGISTRHRFPGLTKKIRILLESYFPEDFGEYVAYMADKREKLRHLNEIEKKKGLQALLETTYESYKWGEK